MSPIDLTRANHDDIPSLSHLNNMSESSSPGKEEDRADSAPQKSSGEPQRPGASHQQPQPPSQNIDPLELRQTMFFSDVFSFENYVKIKCDHARLLRLGDNLITRKWRIPRLISRSLDSFDTLFRARSTILPADLESLQRELAGFEFTWRSLILAIKGGRIVHKQDLEGAKDFLDSCSRLSWKLLFLGTPAKGMRDKLAGALASLALAAGAFAANKATDLLKEAGDDEKKPTQEQKQENAQGARSDESSERGSGKMEAQ